MNSNCMAASTTSISGTRELTFEEQDKVFGGIAPLIGLAVSVAGHFTARSVLTAAAGRIGFGLAVFDTARYFGSGGGSSRLNRKITSK